MRAARGDATGRVFPIAALVGAVGVVAALPREPIALRSSIDPDRSG
ncbi:hypothetical protein [Umezawaea beigongshangensis]|nr:hypothetical protein [Umezawaea beigongshangensis]